ncbi:helix-turn-helix domain-containing protein [Lonepinella sp. BR2923]
MLQSTPSSDLHRNSGGYMKVNEKIRFLRENKNWSQEEMADKLGMSTNGYSKIERGETRLSLPKLEQIVQVLDMDIIELMSLGEKNVVLFSESGNNHSLNIFGSNQTELAIEISYLKKELALKDELLVAKKNEIDVLKQLVKSLRKEPLSH